MVVINEKYMKAPAARCSFIAIENPTNQNECIIFGGSVDYDVQGTKDHLQILKFNRISSEFSVEGAIKERDVFVKNALHYGPYIIACSRSGIHMINSEF